VSDPPLAGRVAIVTGSTKGIGYRIAERLLDQGAQVVVNSRSVDDVRRTTRSLLRRAPKNVLGVSGDVGSAPECRKIVAATVSAFGGVDILVNNAGISMVAPSLELSAQDWERTLRIDLSGAFYMAQASARQMIARKGGSIINISSILGEGGLPKRAAYCAAKHGLIGLTRVLASEWAHLGVRVNAISPAYIRTAMDARDEVTGDYAESDILGRTPLARYGLPEEVADLALFLAGPSSSYITGVDIPVDGGWTAYAGWDRLIEQIRQARPRS
jgi:3-oxoacyl-[acyl-carrier protein] reductase